MDFDPARTSRARPAKSADPLLETGAVLRARDRVPRPWRNGGGFTTEVIGEPRNPAIDNFTWRVSIATVEGDSEFSTFLGVDRYLMPLSPAGLTLEFGTASERIDQFRAHGFAGEVGVRATGVTETSLDLNLMIRRGAARGNLVSQDVDGHFAITARANERVVVVVIAGRFEGYELYDALDIRTESTMVGAGALAIARVQLL